MTLSNKLIDIIDLIFSYGENNFSLKDINLSIENNDFISIIGRNGSGKSTFVKIISRIYKGYQGTINYSGKDIREIENKEFSRQVSYLPQSGIQISEEMTVFELLLLARYPYKKFGDFIFSDKDKMIVEESIRFTQADKFRNKYFHKLSGGEKQKILITLALVQLDITSSLEKKVLIIDEPLTYLDVNYQLEIFSILNKLNKDNNLTIIIITHDLNLALKYTSKTLLLEGGEIISFDETGKVITEEILKKHFLINSKIVKLEDEFHINYNSL
jgi:iron complex transport system ATP-binding protein